MAVYAIIPAAGESRRMGLPERKPFLMLGGETVIRRTCRLFAEHPEIRAYVVMAPADALAQMRRELAGSLAEKLLAVLPGGSSRSESVQLGLSWLSERLGPDESKTALVLVHDGARCLCSAELISRCIACLKKEFCAAAPSLPLRDAVRLLAPDALHSSALPKNALLTVQTPQGAPLELLLQALKEAKEAGREPADELEAIGSIGCPVRLFPGSLRNLKLTQTEDLLCAQAFLEEAQRREQEEAER